MLADCLSCLVHLAPAAGCIRFCCWGWIAKGRSLSESVIRGQDILLSEDMVTCPISYDFRFHVPALQTGWQKHPAVASRRSLVIRWLSRRDVEGMVLLTDLQDLH